MKRAACVVLLALGAGWAQEPQTPAPAQTAPAQNGTMELPPDKPEKGDDEEKPRGTNDIGSMPPNFHLVTADGDRYTQKKFLGRPVLIDFWATWCEPCMSTMPAMKKLREHTRSTDLIMVGVDADHEPEKAQKFYAKQKFDWMDFHRNSSMGRAFPHHAIPTTVLLDAQGRVAYFHTGTKEKGLYKAIARLGPQYAEAVKGL